MTNALKAASEAEAKHRSNESSSRRLDESRTLRIRELDEKEAESVQEACGARQERDELFLERVSSKEAVAGLVAEIIDLRSGAMSAPSPQQRMPVVEAPEKSCEVIEQIESNIDCEEISKTLFSDAVQGFERELFPTSNSPRLDGKGESPSATLIESVRPLSTLAADTGVSSGASIAKADYFDRSAGSDGGGPQSDFLPGFSPRPGEKDTSPRVNGIIPCRIHGDDSVIEGSAAGSSNDGDEDNDQALRVMKDPHAEGGRDRRDPIGHCSARSFFHRKRQYRQEQRQGERTQRARTGKERSGTDMGWV